MQHTNKGFAGIYRAPLEGLHGTDKTVLLHILLNCNHSDNPDFRLTSGKNLPLRRGQWFTSPASLQRVSGLSYQQVRTALKRLIRHEIISSECPKHLTKQGTLISLISPDIFLHTSAPVTKSKTKKQRSNNKAATTNNKNKNDKNVNGIDKSIPHGVEPDLWAEFIKVRKKLKAAPTDHAVKLIADQLELLRLEGHSPNDVIKQSIVNGWKGVFPIKHQHTKLSNATNQEAKNYDQGTSGFITQ